MNERISRLLAGVEVLAIILPVALLSLFAWGTFGIGTWSGRHEWRFLYAALVIATPVLCISIGVLTAQLAFRGRAALSGISPVWWIGTFLGIGLTAIGLVAVVSAKLGVDELLDARLRIFAAGVPLLLPAAHVLLERARANKTIEPTR